MLFLEALRRYLRVVEVGPSLDLVEARRHFFVAAESAEGAGAAEAAEPWGRRLDASQRTWLCYEHGALDAFLLAIATELRAGLCARSDAAELQASVHQAVRLSMNLPVELSRIRTVELSRAARDALEAATDVGGDEDVPRYALEVRAVRATAQGIGLSRIGKVLLNLPQTDALRWLLAIETQQSMGPHDAFRMPRAALEEILRWPGGPCELSPGESWTYSASTLSRLCALGLLTRSDGHDFWSVSLEPSARPLIEEVVSQRRTPLSVLAETLIAEEHGALSGYAAALPGLEPAAEIQARHARLVVHEIRNALVPVRMALTGIYRMLDAQGPRDAWQAQQDRIDRGIERVFRFAEDLQKVAQIAGSPPERFDVVAAIRDAVKGLNGGLAVELALPAVGALPRVLGHRERFTLAIVNILRNAAQNAGQDRGRPRVLVRLQAALSPGEERVTLTIEDDGPGVPEEHRERIFDPGFALRPGGSGQGLALVREVVQVDMKGRVHCEQGDRGGARFVLAIPITPPEPEQESP